MALHRITDIFESQALAGSTSQPVPIEVVRGKQIGTWIVTGALAALFLSALYLLSRKK